MKLWAAAALATVSTSSDVKSAECKALQYEILDVSFAFLRNIFVETTTIVFLKGKSEDLCNSFESIVDLLGKDMKPSYMTEIKVDGFKNIDLNSFYESQNIGQEGETEE